MKGCLNFIYKMQSTLFALSSIYLCVFANLLYRNDDVMRECHCVPRSMCQDNDVTISEGEGLFDIRSDTRVCDNFQEVCCEHIVLQTPEPPVIRGCGMQSAIASGNRITSDSQIAQVGEVPWTVAVLEKNLDVRKYIRRCGGSLIHPQVVITAAHCMTNPGVADWLIRAGEVDAHARDKPPHQDRIVQDVLIHPFYNTSSLKYDVALLILAESVALAESVGISCLPPAGMQLENVKCVASGWGKERLEKGKYSSILKVIELPLVEHEDCQSSLRNTRLGKSFRLHKSFLCAGGEHNKDACKGDGGSPLVCPIPGQPGRYVQLGIVSWGIGCGQNNIPGVYVNTPEIRSWVDQQLTILNFDISSYQYEMLE